MAILVAGICGCAGTPSPPRAPDKLPVDTHGPVADTLTPKAPSGPDSSTAQQKWIDSLNRIVKRGLYGKGNRNNLVETEIAYIKANGALGDFYAQQFINGQVTSMAKALKYYNAVAGLTEGTDSDLGDGGAAVEERDKVCRKVAALYKKNLLQIDSSVSPYVGAFIDGASIDFPHCCRLYPNDSILATIRFIPGVTSPSRTARHYLRRLIAVIPDTLYSKIVVEAGGNYNNLTQQFIG